MKADGDSWDPWTTVDNGGLRARDVNSCLLLSSPLYHTIDMAIDMTIESWGGGWGVEEVLLPVTRMDGWMESRTTTRSD